MNQPNQENCLIDNRVSSPKQATGTSLEIQESRATHFAQKKGWNIARVYTKVYSGAKEHREDFKEILQFIKDSRKTPTPIHHYIITCIDRFTRAGIASYENMKNQLTRLGVQLHDVDGLIQPEQNTLEDLGFEYPWSKISPTESAQLAAAQESKQERIRILNRMIRPIIVLTQQGYHVGPPNDGFINAKIVVDGKERPIQVPDPKRAKYFETLFELSARRTLTDKEIVARINAMGYLSKDRNMWSKGLDKRIIGVRKGQPMTVKKLQSLRLITRYAGVQCCRHTHFKPVKAMYDGLVSIDTFNKANRGKMRIEELADGKLAIFYGEKTTERQVSKRLKHRPTFAYDKCLLCPSCRLPTYTSASTGKSGRRYPYYHCSRGHHWAIPKDEFEATVDEFLDSLAVRPERIEGLKARLVHCYNNREKETAAKIVDVQRNISELEAQQTAVYTDHRATTSAVMKRKLEEEIEDLELRIDYAKQESVPEIGIEKPDIDDFLEHATEIFEHPRNLLKNNASVEVQKAFWQLVFAETPTYDEIQLRTPKLTPFFATFATSGDDKSLSAGTEGFDWNTWAEIIKQWNDVFAMRDGSRQS